MARGRMVNKKISNSKRVNDLPLPAQLLFTWLIPHLDCNGVFFGSPQMVKSLVFPRKSYTTKQVSQWLDMMQNANNDNGIPLIDRFQVDGEFYIFMPGFEGEQVGLRKDKESPEYPQTTEEIRQKYGKYTEQFRQDSVPHARALKGKGREGEVEVKQEEKINNKTITPTPLPENELLLSSDKEVIEKDVFVLYEEEIGEITQVVRDTMVDAVEHFSDEWVRDAIKEASRSGKRNLRYIEGILKNWATNGRDFKPIKQGYIKSRDPEKFKQGLTGEIIKRDQDELEKRKPGIKKFKSMEEIKANLTGGSRPRRPS